MKFQAGDRVTITQGYLRISGKMVLWDEHQNWWAAEVKCDDGRFRYIKSDDFGASVEPEDK